MKRLLLLLASGLAVTAFAVPSVDSVTMTANADGTVTVGYRLTGAPAIITLDILKDGTSIGERLVQPLEGDVNVKVTEDGAHAIVWRPRIGWAGNVDDLKAQVSAWTTDDPPDYMVVDLRSGPAKTEAARVRYYTSTNALPGGLMENLDYRTCQLVFRRIKAKGVTWSMGIPDGPTDAAPHDVTMDHDYYMSIFPVTQSQYMKVAGSANTTGGTPTWFVYENAMRVTDKLPYPFARHATGTMTAALRYPNPPSAGSFFGKLRALVGDADGEVFDFDLPSEARWEYAARGGHAADCWGDGSPIEIVSGKDPHLAELGRYYYNGGMYYNGSTYVNPYAPVAGKISTVWGVTNATPVVGSYRPNSYGIYDMNGSGEEWCLDVYTNDITQLSGAVYSPSISAKVNFVVRGGNFYTTASGCRPGARSYADPDNVAGIRAVRVVTRAGLK